MSADVLMSVPLPPQQQRLVQGRNVPGTRLPRASGDHPPAHPRIACSGRAAVTEVRPPQGQAPACSAWGLKGLVPRTVPRIVPRPVPRIVPRVVAGSRRYL